jgi:hypothetical protein
MTQSAKPICDYLKATNLMNTIPLLLFWSGKLAKFLGLERNLVGITSDVNCEADAA